MTDLVSVLIDGIIYSSWLFIIAVGLTLIYGVMKILNIAHGSLYALGAYAGGHVGRCMVRARLSPMAVYALLVLAAVVVGVVAGPLIERGLLRFMYGKDEVVLMLVTYALFLILEDLIKLVWGVDPLFCVSSLTALLGNFEVGGLTYPMYNLLLVGVAIVVGVGADLRV